MYAYHSTILINFRRETSLGGNLLTTGALGPPPGRARWVSIPTVTGPPSPWPMNKMKSKYEHNRVDVLVSSIYTHVSFAVAYVKCQMLRSDTVLNVVYESRRWVQSGLFERNRDSIQHVNSIRTQTTKTDVQYVARHSSGPKTERWTEPGRNTLTTNNTRGRGQS